MSDEIYNKKIATSELDVLFFAFCTDTSVPGLTEVTDPIEFIKWLCRLGLIDPTKIEWDGRN